MNIKIKFFIILNFLFSTNLFAQLADLNTHNELKDSIIARFNRNDFESIYQLADTSSFTTSKQNFARFLRNNKNNFGQVLNGTFLSDSMCDGCNSKRAKYYLLNFQLKYLILLLEVSSSKKFSSFGLLNYTSAERTNTSDIKTNNPVRNSFDLSVDSAAREYFRNPYATGLSIGIIKNGKKFTYHYGETKKGNNQLPSDTNLSVR